MPPMKTALGSKHLLIVEDDFGDIMLFHEALADIQGFILHPAIDVMQARAFLERKPPFAAAPVPALIFLDVRLPVFPGYCLLPVIRGEPRLKGVKVVVFTSSENENDRRRCRELGADDYLVKPRDWPEWKSVVLDTLSRHCGLADDGSGWKYAP
jgi:CheY-like chemotaxis protein